MVWHELKDWLRSVHKAHSKEQLIAGIHQFWEEKMTPAKCQKYISHIRKVIPEIIKRDGQATGMWMNHMMAPTDTANLTIG